MSEFSIETAHSKTQTSTDEQTTPELTLNDQCSTMPIYSQIIPYQLCLSATVILSQGKEEVRYGCDKGKTNRERGKAPGGQIDQRGFEDNADKI